MGTPTTRRQNSSCDPCRRSKKRCAFEADLQPGTSAACQNCKHLGHRCTFGFAAAQAAQKRMKMSCLATSAPSVNQDQPQQPPAMISPPASTNPEFLWAASPPVTDLVMDPDDTIWADLGLNDVLDFNSFVANNPYDWMDLPDKTLEIQSTGPEANEPEFPASFLTSDDSRPQQSDEEPRISASSISGFWHGSPVRLLNSRVVAEQLNTNLCQVYDSMMMSLANRYLSYRCNQFAGGYSYIIESENEADQLAVCPSSSATTTCREYSQSSPLGRHTVSQAQESGDFQDPEKTVQPCRRITLIGVAHFLDNFGALYGNKLDNRKRKLDEATLTAVLHAFALQSTSGDDGFEEPSCADKSQVESSDSNRARNNASNRDIFHAAWFKAYSLLLKSKGNRSFVHLHTVFVFHMMAQPKEVLSKGDFGEDPVCLLDDALYQLRDLLNLVESFCSRLDPKSLYRAMLESSRRIIRWFGYVRDTVASFVSDRVCILEDVQIPNADLVPFGCATMTITTLDNQTPEISQNASRTMFTLFRETIRLRRLLQPCSQNVNQASVSKSIEALTNIVEAFHASHLDWMKQCVANFLNLSTRSKQSAAFFIIFWNMGVLRVVELIREACKAMDPENTGKLLKTAQNYEKEAVLRFSSVAKRINHASVSGDLRLTEFSENKLPLISHHANTGLVVFALKKAIEHMISSNLSIESPTALNIDANIFSVFSGDCMTSIRLVLACLSTLDRTVSGQNLARPVLQDLVCKYSDVLLDCWTPDIIET